MEDQHYGIMGAVGFIALFSRDEKEFVIFSIFV